MPVADAGTHPPAGSGDRSRPLRQGYPDAARRGRMPDRIGPPVVVAVLRSV